MIRLLATALVLSLAAPAAAQTSALEQARLESEAYPQDYGAAVRLAAAATAAERHDLALLAWDRAVAVSGGNLDTALGRTVTLLALDRGREARAQAAEATTLAPESSPAWTTRGWALRNATGFAPPQYHLLGSEVAYTRATHLDPGDRTAACGLAWTRLLLGDRIGARIAFGRMVEADLGDACALEGGAAAAPRVRFGGTTSFTGTLYGPGAPSTGGISVAGRAWGLIDELVGFQVAGRGSVTDPASGGYGQWEVWGGASVKHRGLGLEFLGAVLGSNDRAAIRGVVGGRAWATFGPSLILEASRGMYSDGDVSNLAAILKVPTTSFLTLHVGAAATWSTGLGQGPGGALIGQPYAPPSPDPVLPSARFGATLSSPPGERGVDLTVEGRVGPELRPVRFDEPSVWNVLGRMVGSLDIDARIRLPRGGGLLLGYEIVGLQRAGEPTYQTHLITVGLSVGGSGDLP